MEQGPAHQKSQKKTEKKNIFLRQFTGNQPCQPIASNYLHNERWSATEESEMRAPQFIGDH